MRKLFPAVAPRVDLNYRKPAAKAAYAFPNEPVRFGRESMREYFTPEYPTYKEECIRRTGTAIDVSGESVKQSHAFLVAGMKGHCAEAVKQIAWRVMYQDVGGVSAVGAVAYAEKYGGASQAVALGTTITRTGADTVVVNTPGDMYKKHWVAGAGCTAIKEAMVAGELIDENGENRGMHFVNVRIRNDAGRAVEGVAIDNMPDFPELEFATLSFRNVQVKLRNGEEDLVPADADVYGKSRMASAAFSIGDCTRKLRDFLQTARATFDEDSGLGRKVSDLQLTQVTVACLISELVALKHLYTGTMSSENEVHSFPPYIYANVCKVAASDLSLRISRALTPWRGLAALEVDTLPPELLTMWPGDNALLLQDMARDYLDLIADRPRDWIEESVLRVRQARRYPQLPMFVMINQFMSGRLIGFDRPADCLDHLAYLLTMRVRVQLFELRREMEAVVGDLSLDTTAFEHWTQGMPHRTTAFARSFTDLVTFNNFRQGVRSAPLLVRPTLEAWLKLYAMQTVQRNMAWYLADGCVSPTLAGNIDIHIRHYAADVVQDADALLACL